MSLPPRYKRNERLVLRRRPVLARGRQAPRHGLAAVLVAAALLIGGFILFFRPAPERPVDDRAVVALLTGRYFSDQGAREELEAIQARGRPAFARLARLDENGTWSRLYLGPFPNRPAAAEVLGEMQDREIWRAAVDITPDEEDEPNPAEGRAAPVVVELTALVSDEAVLDELSFPQAHNVYALARTALIDPDGYAQNRLYLGPFANEEEAASVMDGLVKAWPLAASYSFRYLDPPLE